MGLFPLFVVALVVIAQLFSSSNAFQLWHKRDDNNNDVDRRQRGKDDDRSVSLRHLFSKDFLDDMDPYDLVPFHHHNRYRGFLDRFFDHADWDDFNNKGNDIMKSYSPLLNTDLVESDTDFHLSIDLPGIDPKDMEVSIEDTHSNNKILRIKAERRQAHETSHPEDAETCKKRGLVDGETTCPSPKPRWIKQERIFGKIERQFRLPMNADVNNAQTNYNHGVLSISLPKLAQINGGNRRTLSVTDQHNPNNTK
jgi:HSP20 family protein